MLLPATKRLQVLTDSCLVSIHPIYEYILLYAAVSFVKEPLYEVDETLGWAPQLLKYGSQLDISRKLTNKKDFFSPLLWLVIEKQFLRRMK